MNILDLFPPSDLLKQLEGIESGLKQRSRSGNIVLLYGLFQAAILFVSSPWLTQLIRDLPDLPYGLPRWIYVFIIIVFALVPFAFGSWAKFWLKESQEPFRYTCSIANFEPVTDSPEVACMTWLPHDLALYLNERIKRLSFLDDQLVKISEDSAPTSDEGKDRSHIHIRGYYLIRDDSHGKKTIEITPRVRIGARRSAETLAHRVQFGEATESMAKPGAAGTTGENSHNLQFVTREGYEQLLERVYFSIATEVYRQINEDVKHKIELLPTNYFKAVALLHEAEDYARSNTLDAYDEALALFDEARRLFDPSDSPVKSLAYGRIRLWFQRLMRWWITQCWRKLKAWLAHLWPRLGQVALMCARAEVGYANMLNYRRMLAGLSGRVLNPVFEARWLVDKALERLESLPKDEWTFVDCRFDAHVARAITFLLLGDATEADEELRVARVLDQKTKLLKPKRTDLESKQTDKEAQYLFAKAFAEPHHRPRLNFLRQAVELEPRYHIAQFMLAETFEAFWRRRPQLERKVAELVFQEYDAVLKTNRGTVAAWAKLGYMHWLLNSPEDVEAAKKKYKYGRDYKNISRRTFVAELDWGLARISAEEGDFSQAYEHYLNAVSADLSQGVAHYSSDLSNEGYFFDGIDDELLNRFETYKGKVAEHFAFWEGKDDQGPITNEELHSTKEEARLKAILLDLLDPASREKICTRLRPVLSALSRLEKETLRQVAGHEVTEWIMGDLKAPSDYKEAVQKLRQPDCMRLLVKHVPTQRVRKSIYAFVLTEYGDACYSYYQRIGQEDWLARARAAYVQAHTMNPENVMPWYKRGRLEFQTGQYKEACKCLTEVKRREPNWQEGILWLAEAEAFKAYPTKEADELDKAIEELKKLLPDGVAKVIPDKQTRSKKGFGAKVESVLKNRIEWKKLDDPQVEVLFRWASILSLQPDSESVIGCQKLLTHIQKEYSPGPNIRLYGLLRQRLYRRIRGTIVSLEEFLKQGQAGIRIITADLCDDSVRPFAGKRKGIEIKTKDGKQIYTIGEASKRREESWKGFSINDEIILMVDGNDTVMSAEVPREKEEEFELDKMQLEHNSDHYSEAIRTAIKRFLKADPLNWVALSWLGDVAFLGSEAPVGDTSRKVIGKQDALDTIRHIQLKDARIGCKLVDLLAAYQLRNEASSLIKRLFQESDRLNALSEENLRGLTHHLPTGHYASLWLSIKHNARNMDRSTHRSTCETFLILARKKYQNREQKNPDVIYFDHGRVFYSNLILTWETTAKETAEEFASGQLASLKQARPGFHLVQEGPEQFGRNRCFLREYTFTAHDRRVCELQFYLLSMGSAYTATYTYLASKLDSANRTFAQQLFSQIDSEGLPHVTSHPNRETPDVETFNPNLVFSRGTTAKETAEEFASGELAALKQALPGFHLVQEGPEQFGRNRGFLREYTFTAHDMRIGQLQFYLLSLGSAYTATYSHLASKLDSANRTFAQQLFSQIDSEGLTSLPNRETPDVETFNPNLVFTWETTAKETAEEFASGELAALKQALPGFHLVQEGPEQFGRNRGFLREYTFTAHDMRIGQLQFYLLSLGSAYTATYSHLASKLDAYRTVADQYFAQIDPEGLAMPVASEHLAVPPIQIRVYARPGAWDEIQDQLHRSKYTSEMQARIKADTGVEVPNPKYDVFLSQSDLRGDGYQILLNGFLAGHGIVYPKNKFCSSPALIRKVCGGNASEAFNPSTNKNDGAWLTPSQWERVKRQEAAIWEPFEYIMRHLESILRADLSRFLGFPEIDKALHDWVTAGSEKAREGDKDCISRRKIVQHALPDLDARVEFLRVLRGLVKEGVCVNNLEAMLEVFYEFRGKPQRRESMAIIEAIRMKLQNHLPGNDKSYEFLRLSDAFEEEVKCGIRRSNGKLFFATSSQMAQTLLSSVKKNVGVRERKVCLVTRTEGIRPFVRRLIQEKFPQIMVLSQEELLPDLGKKTLRTIDHRMEQM